MRMSKRSLFVLTAMLGIGLVVQASGKSDKRARHFGAGYFPNVKLRTHEGKEVRFYDDLVKGKIVAINMFYANCTGVCIPTMANLKQAQKLLGDRVGRDIFFYSISIRPEEDSLKALVEYAERMGVGRGWQLLTGSQKDIDLIRRKLGFVDVLPEVDADKSQHTGMVRYGNEPLERWGACPGAGKPEFIAQSILWVDHPRKVKADNKHAGTGPCCTPKTALQGKP